MGALAADANLSTVGDVITLPFSANAADTFYRGSIVYTDAAGGVQVTYASTVDRALGISPKTQTAAGAGSIVEVIVFGAIWLPIGSGIAAADEGDRLMVDISATSSDNPADCVSMTDMTEATGDMILGQILRVTTAQMLVFLSPGFTGRALVATTTNLTS